MCDMTSQIKESTNVLAAPLLVKLPATAPAKQRKVTQVHGLLPPTWEETQIAFYIPSLQRGPVLVMWPPRGKSVNERSLSFSPSPLLLSVIVSFK